jgi:gentisate 1,2-dioxygenase
MPLPERPWRNNRGQWFDLAVYDVPNAHLALKPGSQSARHGNTTEAYTCCAKGRGFRSSTTRVNPGIVGWSAGTLFAPPWWAWRRHFNLNKNVAT